jgi:hypothetical protein
LPDVIVIFLLPYAEPGGKRRKRGEYARIPADLAQPLIAGGIARLLRVVKESDEATED